MIRRRVRRRILKKDDPADATHRTDRVEGRLPLLDGAEGLDEDGRQRRAGRRISSANSGWIPDA